MKTWPGPHHTCSGPNSDQTTQKSFIWTRLKKSFKTCGHNVNNKENNNNNMNNNNNSDDDDGDDGDEKFKRKHIKS